MEKSQNKYSIVHKEVPMANLRQHAFGKATYSPSAIPALADAIQTFGGLIHNPKATGPDTDGLYTILAGWRRKLAAEQLGWDSMFIDVIHDLPQEEEVMYILESNNYRDKTPAEKYAEIKELEIQLPNRQGRRTPDPDGEPYNQRAEIAKRINASESQVRDLKTIGEHPKGDELLGSIDGKNVTLTALARKIRETTKGLDYSGIIPVERISLDLSICPICSAHPTLRIEVIERELFFAA